MLPPTPAAFLPHLLCANYISMRDKSYTKTCPELPPIQENGWNSKGEHIIPVQCLELPAPKAVLELVKCGCKSGCGGRCSWSNNMLPCTPLCKCYGGDCLNQMREEIEESDEEEVWTILVIILSHLKYYGLICYKYCYTFQCNKYFVIHTFCLFSF